MFGERLKQARIKAKYSQEEIAEIINTSRSNISKYECEKLEPNIETLRQLCILYRVSADYVIGIKDNDNGKFDSININQHNNNNAVINIGSKK